MTFEQILDIIPKIQNALDSGKTQYQIAADIHAEHEASPSALKVQPIKERAKRGPNKPKATPVDGGFEPLANGHDNHVE